jgi:hypothetical protein
MIVKRSGRPRFSLLQLVGTMEPPVHQRTVASIVTKEVDQVLYVEVDAHKTTSQITVMDDKGFSAAPLL